MLGRSMVELLIEDKAVAVVAIPVGAPSCVKAYAGFVGNHTLGALPDEAVYTMRIWK